MEMNKQTILWLFFYVSDSVGELINFTRGIGLDHPWVMWGERGDKTSWCKCEETGNDWQYHLTACSNDTPHTKMLSNREGIHCLHFTGFIGTLICPIKQWVFDSLGLRTILDDMGRRRPCERDCGVASVHKL